MKALHKDAASSIEAASSAFCTEGVAEILPMAGMLTYRAPKKVGYASKLKGAFAISMMPRCAAAFKAMTLSLKGMSSAIDFEKDAWKSPFAKA